MGSMMTVLWAVACLTLRSSSRHHLVAALGDNGFQADHKSRELEENKEFFANRAGKSKGHSPHPGHHDTSSKHQNLHPGTHAHGTSHSSRSVHDSADSAKHKAHSSSSSHKSSSSRSSRSKRGNLNPSTHQRHGH
jgi:hypothetical protein